MSYHNFMDGPLRPRERSWTKDSVLDIFEVLFISERCRNATLSQQVFETWTVSKSTKYFGMKVIVLKYIMKYLDDIAPLSPSLASKCVASRCEQAPKHVFQSLAFSN